MNIHIELLTLAPIKYSEHVFFRNFGRDRTKTVSILLIWPIVSTINIGHQRSSAVHASI